MKCGAEMCFTDHSPALSDGEEVIQVFVHTLWKEYNMLAGSWLASRKFSTLTCLQGEAFLACVEFYHDEARSIKKP